LLICGLFKLIYRGKIFAHCSYSLKMPACMSGPERDSGEIIKI
jgi:hypothetical protein